MKFLSALMTLVLFTLPFSSLGATPKYRIGLVKINAVVDDETATIFINDIRKAQESKVDYIVVEINTPGGSVPAGMEMAKVIERSSIPVLCVVDGMAASMGFYLLQSCHIRTMTRRSLLMAHEPSLSGRISGRPQDLQDIADMSQKLANAMSEHEAARLCISVEDFRKRIHQSDWWMDWTDAKKICAIDLEIASLSDIVVLINRL